VLTIQAEVATAIAREVGGTIATTERPRLDRRQAVDPEVYDLYLKGRFEQARRSADGFANAIARFEEAGTRDPSFAPAFAGLADTYTLMSRSVFGGLATSQAMERARSAAERAVALDPLSVEAHLAMASVSHRFDWDWETAERHYNRARDLGPAYAPAHQWIAVFLAEQQRPEPARIEAERAISLDPLSATVLRTAGLVAYFNRDFERSVQLHRHAVSLEPGSAVSTIMLAWSLVEAGQPAEAAAEVRGIRSEAAVDREARATLGYALARQGDLVGARQIRQALEREQAAPTLALARLYSSLGDEEALVQLAERAVAARLDLVTGLKADIVFDRVRAHPRFKALAERLHF
jgi:tetratricopeptide (TPR) repeat protein